MTKQWFRRFPINDLTWGINIRDYPSEIEDKQAIEIENFNFKGNKLVSSNWVKIVDNPPSPSRLLWLTKDSDDIYTIKKEWLYKNWDLTNKQNVYDIVFTDNPDGKIWSVGINGINMVIRGGFANNEDVAFNSIVAQLKTKLGGSYRVKYIGKKTITIEANDYSLISFTKPNLVKQAQLTSWNEHTNIDIVIDGKIHSLSGVTYTYARDAILALKASLDTFDYYSEADGDTLIIARTDGNPVSIISTKPMQYTYKVTGNASSIGNPSQINLGIGGSSGPVTTKSLSAMFDGKSVSYNYPYWTDDGNRGFNYDYGGFAGLNSVGLSNKEQEGGILARLTYDALSDASVYVRGAPTQIPTSGADKRRLTFDVRRKDYARMANSDSVTYYSNGKTVTQDSGRFNVVETAHLASLTVSPYKETVNKVTNTWVKLWWQTLYQMVIWNTWTLLIDRRGIDSVFIKKDWTPKELHVSQVWVPSVWIIYLGKIILGWYKDSDNIIFSKTYSPTNEDDIYDFSSYSAGWQSVSWGNKWTITWFFVWENWLYVFKENEVWYSSKEKDNWSIFNFVFNRITSNGALNQEVITSVNEDIFYYDHKNRAVRRLGYEKDLTTLRDVAVSREIEGILKDLPIDQTYATSSFSYPNYKLSVRSNNASKLIETYPWDVFREDKPLVWLKYANDLNLIYNVENKSWTIEQKSYNGTLLDTTHSYEDVMWDSNGKAYIDNVWNIQLDGTYLSKEYTFTTDVQYKVFWEFEIVWDIIPEAWETKSLEIELLLDWNPIELQVDNDPSKRIITSNSNKLRFRERIELYDDGRAFQFRLKHKWKWKVEISDVNIKWKREKGYEDYY